MVKNNQLTTNLRSFGPTHTSRGSPNRGIRLQWKGLMVTLMLAPLYRTQSSMGGFQIGFGFCCSEPVNDMLFSLGDEDSLVLETLF